MSHIQIRSWAAVLKTRWVILGLLLLAFMLRLTDLLGTPPGIDGDETFYFFDALRVLSGDFRLYYETNYGHEPLFIYALAGMLRLLGFHAFTMRYTAVLGGMLMTTGAYVLSRRLFNQRVALVTLTLVATLFWPVFLTRVGLRAFTYSLLSIYSMYALWRALQDRSWRWTIAAGGLMGLVAYTYLASRVFPGIVLGWLVGLWCFQRTWVRDNLQRLSVAFGLATLIALPYGIYAFQHIEVVNQRVDTMGGPFAQLKRGELTGLADNTLKVAGMFTVKGDPESRYNAEARPIFEPVTGLFFYLGMLGALYQFRRPQFLLVWPWLGVGLLPTLLSSSAPAFLRITGALFPILVLPGIGLDWSWQRLVALWPKLGSLHLFNGLILAGAGGLSLFLTSVMFGGWRTSPNLMQVYESDLYLIGQYLQAKPPVPDTQIVITGPDPWNSGPAMIKLQTPYEFNARYTSGSVFVWPAAQTESLYFFNAETLPTAQQATWLSVPPETRYTDGQGEPILEVYRLPHPPRVPNFDHPILARFDQLLDLIGVSYPPVAERGQTITGTLFWQVRRDLSFNLADQPGIGLRLFSRDIEWASTGGWMLYPVTQWRVGDVWAQTFTLNVPPDMPPQTIQPSLIIGTQAGMWPVIPAGETLARTQLALPGLVITGHPTSPALETSIARGEKITLSAATLLTKQSEPGLPVFVKTTWYAQQALTQDYRLQLQLTRPDRDPIMVTRTLLGEMYPTSQWQTGESVSSNDALTVPLTAQTGDYEFKVRLIDADGQPVIGEGWNALGNVTLLGRPHQMELPPDLQPTSADFGDFARLVGYRLNTDTAYPQGALKITLVWQVLRSPPAALKVFAHLYGFNNTIDVLAQHDSDPGNGELPTTTWLPGEYIEDEHTLELNADLPPGQYRLGVGMYDPNSLQRVPVRIQEAEADVVVLVEVTVRQP